MKKINDGLEKALWSVAIPGFGQLMNGKHFKGAILIILEFLINYKSNLNLAIISSLYGETQSAVTQTDYKWLMFYPCVYSFSIYDAYKDGQKTDTPLLFIPFVISCYSGTIGVIFSSTFKITGVLIGPIFLPALFSFIGFIIGYVIKVGVLKLQKKDPV